MYPSESLQIVHMGWACECPEGSAPGRSSTFKFLALRGPYFYIFKSPPVICFFPIFLFNMERKLVHFCGGSET